MGKDAYFCIEGSFEGSEQSSWLDQFEKLLLDHNTLFSKEMLRLSWI